MAYVRKNNPRKHPLCPITGKTAMGKCRCADCLRVRAEYQRKLRRDNPDMIKRGNLSAYGLTLAEWNLMLVAQNGVCAVCFQPERGENQHGVMALAVDHDHNTGAVRALLCHRCNRALGLLGDNADRVQALANYRRRFLND